jgi:uncharacterized LabA/DUF88 family protein
MASRVVIFLDYQNVHLGAAELFASYGAPVEDALVHPVKIAERVLEKRRAGGECTGIRVYRGRPNPERQPTLTAANDAQTSAWERDPRVVVRRRVLNYRGWPDERPREKGVDVALAIDVVRMAMLDEYDVGIIFSSDTDLVPAIETAFKHTKPNIEIACWSGAKPLWLPEYLPTRYLPFCHFLNDNDFEQVRDRTQYLGPR